VLFFPPAGAEQSIARPLVGSLGELRLGVLRLPGRAARRDEPAPTDLPTLLDAITGSVLELAGPAPVLVGHSFGGLLAFGVAGAVERAGHRIGRLITIASVSPRSWAEELAAHRRAHPGEGRSGFVARRSARILAQGGVPAEIAAHAEFGAQSRALLAVDLGLSYQGFPPAPIRAPITAIRARDDTMVERSAIAGWAAATRGHVEQVTVPGQHFFYRDDPQRLATRLRLEVQALDAGYDHA
jgi:surfactin synthase thioesterase subunit